MRVLLLLIRMENELGAITIDHGEIRDWVEDRGGRPALARESDEAKLRIDFGDSKESLEAVGWKEFFKRFEAGNLAFFYDSDADNGSGFSCAFVDRADHEERIENGGVIDEEEFEDEREEMEEEEL